MRAFIFPGQGSQSVGMGKALAETSAAARILLQEVDDALSQNLARLMAEGPDDELTLTENAQPAIMANSLAVLRVLEQEAGLRLVEKADCVAGHSLGEYSALVAVGALSFRDAVRVVRERGRLMQQAVPVDQGAMAVILGLAVDSVRALCAEASHGEVVAPANYNGGGQVVGGGRLSTGCPRYAHSCGWQSVGSQREPTAIASPPTS